MKQQKTRELLVTTKVAQKWEGKFDARVDELMRIVSTMDNSEQVYPTAELLDVYTNTHKPLKLKKIKKEENKPFEFLVFCN